VDLGDINEEGYPTFGIFVVLGPGGEKNMSDYRQVGRAFAITLSNEITAELMVESNEKTEILSAMDSFLESATVLPNMPTNSRAQGTVDEYNQQQGINTHGGTVCCCIPMPQGGGDGSITIRLPHEEESMLQQKIIKRLETRGQSSLREVHDVAHARSSRDLSAEEHKKLEQARQPFDLSTDWPWAIAIAAFAAGLVGIMYLTTENIWIEDEFHGDPATGFSFNEIYATLTLFVSIWVAGKLSTMLGMPSLVGEILIGVVLGPNLLEFAPKVGALKMIGEIGLMLLVVEAGLDVDLEMLRLIGVRGLLVAIIGSMLPLAIGFLIGSQVMNLDTKGAFVVGASVAPTSMGIALNVLRGGGKLQTPVGQLIIAAAVLDDIIALILLSEIKALENPTAWAFMKPIVAAMALLVVFGSFAIWVMPLAMDKLIKPRVAEKNHENLILGLIFVMTLAMAPTALAAGSSYLLGCFIAGFCFCTEKLVHHVWVSQVKRILSWLLRIFFACTIGFEIPIKSFGDGQVIAYAMILMLAIFGKLITGFFAHRVTTDNVLTISFAMSAWGEFAFIVVLYGKEEVRHIFYHVFVCVVCVCVCVTSAFSPYAVSSLHLVLTLPPSRPPSSLHRI
jgi:Kef-type K+ transport system membrane component KefB